jgi:hypothetical protein
MSTGVMPKSPKTVTDIIELVFNSLDEEARIQFLFKYICSSSGSAKRPLAPAENSGELIKYFIANEDLSFLRKMVKFCDAPETSYVKRTEIIRKLQEEGFYFPKGFDIPKELSNNDYRHADGAEAWAALKKLTDLLPEMTGIGTHSTVKTKVPKKK